jgi:hypothetical protein
MSRASAFHLDPTELFAANKFVRKDLLAHRRGKLELTWGAGRLVTARWLGRQIQLHHNVGGRVLA